jgi:hypothetical protein
VMNGDSRLTMTGAQCHNAMKTRPAVWPGVYLPTPHEDRIRTVLFEVGTRRMEAHKWYQ